jgi:hypothetical protein
MKTTLTNFRKTTLLALCALALSPAALFAGNALKTAEQRGIIKSVDSHARQIILTDQKTKADRVFHWNDQTKFTEQAKTVSASALTAGLPVHITYAPGSGTPLLERVQISAVKEPKPAAAASAHQKTLTHHDPAQGR